MTNLNLKWVRSQFDPAGVKKYVTQISLILISLSIATNVDRCREAAKNREKLQEYCIAISEDIKSEIEVEQMNMNDCKRDIKCLSYALYYVNLKKKDSIPYIFSNVREVISRGVFRAFKPSTLEMMTQAGEISLLKDLNLRNKLASAFAYRDDVIKKDFFDFDHATERYSEKFGQFVNLSALQQNEKARMSQVTPAELLDDPHNELYLLLRNAQLKGFHLQNGIAEMEEAQEQLQAFMLAEGFIAANPK